ncbi:MAG: TldD/PmbA family protein [Solobacterium sp.]|nr:TldD/PmbA family protein [Solobacterium sp.]
MLETIIRLLKEAETDGWEVTDTVTEGWEFYFIRHQLDQNRIRNVEHLTVNVFRKFDTYLGNAKTEIPVTATEEDARHMIEMLIAEAQLVKNPVYSLNEPDGETPAPAAYPDVRSIAKDFLDVMKDLPETATEDINSFEVFVNANRTRFLNSNGIDVTSVYPTSMLEVVVNARRESHEIELYRLYHSGTCDKEGLKKEISETLQYGKDKLAAVNTPNLGKYSAVFSTDASKQIYDYFISRMSTAMKYRKLSNWEIGKPIAEGVKGDRVTIKALRTLENSSANQAYDREGAKVRDLLILDQNIPVQYYGPRQFSQYLDVKDSFIPGNFMAEGGTKSASELRCGNYLEIVEFSDFQVETMTGAIAGEIRLGYLHEGDKMTIVSGGSVSGSMTDFVKEMYLSKELKQYNNMLIPAVTRLEQVSVTGAE